MAAAWLVSRVTSSSCLIPALAQSFSPIPIMAGCCSRHKAELAKDRERLVIPADPAQVNALAKQYTSKDLGQITVLNQDGGTTFQFDGFKSRVASRKNDDVTTSFITTDPGADGFEFVVGERSGKKVLVIRDGQHEYTFTRLYKP